MAVLLNLITLATAVAFASVAHASSSLQDATADLQHARNLLARYQLIDTHVDTPQVLRVLARQPLDMLPDLNISLPGQFDLPRARQGGVGGAFFTVWTPCQDLLGIDVGQDFQQPDQTIRDTIESIDLIREMIDYEPSLQYATTAAEAEQAFSNGKIAALIGMEGSHMLGNSLSTIRILARLGVRYLTLTHTCHSSFASSAGGGAGTDGSFLRPVHPGNGLTAIGRELVKELNRLGVIVDLSHVSDQTMTDVLDITDVPIAFTHSGARGVNDHPRNVPDEILARIGPGKNEGIIQSVLFKHFIDSNNATIPRVVDHVEYIALHTSRQHVGLASDFDGMGEVVEGMEDCSKWPSLVAEFIRRGWTDEEIKGLLGGNLLRVMRAVEQAAYRRRDERPSSAIYGKRTDLPASNWGGPNGAYLPGKVKAIVDRRHLRDEL
ncbi:hypothetical protein IAR55_002602 [Kwoniella newhampshirensis]|uniref:Dipeptidase n=1 Tax=Kwoniella newhampshirensis TaxID=1651941 RepID=A0AAW0Z1Y0_9TREE